MIETIPSNTNKILYWLRTIICHSESCKILTSLFHQNFITVIIIHMISVPQNFRTLGGLRLNLGRWSISFSLNIVRNCSTAFFSLTTIGRPECFRTSGLKELLIPSFAVSFVEDLSTRLKLWSSGTSALLFPLSRGIDVLLFLPSCSNRWISPKSIDGSRMISCCWRSSSCHCNKKCQRTIIRISYYVIVASGAK